MKVAFAPNSTRRNDNPFLSILQSALAAQGCRTVHPKLFFARQLDALHVHWLEAPIWGRFAARLPGLAEFRVLRLVQAARRLRAQGRPVVWTAHNLAPHDFASKRHERIYRWMREGFLPHVTDVICMSETVRAQVADAFPALATARFHVVRHPHYRTHFAGMRKQTPGELQRLSQVRGKTIVTFGMLRPYKGIPATVLALRGLAREFRFVVAGDGPSAELRAIRRAMGDDPRFLLISRRLDDNEIAGLTGEADLVIFNFRSVLNSGSVLASLSLGKPVLAPALGAIRDLSEDIGPGYVRMFEGDLRRADIEAALVAAPPTAEPDLRAYDPEAVARQHIEIYGARAGALRRE